MAPVVSSWGEAFSRWVLETQRDLHRRLTFALRQFDTTPTLISLGSLFLLSFLYGVFHAVGPGHGKAVISAYLLTHPGQAWRGILLSVASALLQGLTAITLVLVLVEGLGWMTRSTLGQVRTLELFSFALIGLLGVALMLRALYALWKLRRTSRTAFPAGPRYQRLPSARPGLLGTVPMAGQPRRPAAVAGEACACGVAHHVDPNARAPWYATLVAVGIRPCSGAVLVMMVALMLGMGSIGAAAVMAMSAGTALTVSLIAWLAVTMRHTAVRLSGVLGLPSVQYAGPLVALLGGVLILWLGSTLFWGVWSQPPMSHPLGIR
jgi:nickel/cobalt exporter